MKTLSVVALVSLSILMTGCGAHTSLTPVGKGQLAPSVSIGGPIVEAFGTHIPIPYLMAGTEYGLSDAVNLGGQAHLLPLAYGIAGVDVGATWYPLLNRGWQPTLGLGPRLFAFASLKEDVEERFFVFPTVSGSAAWAAGRGLFYTGADLALPVSQPDYDAEAASVVFSPFAGYRWDIGRRHALLTEVKWHGANVGTNDVATNYTAIGGRGAITPLFALQRRF